MDYTLTFEGAPASVPGGTALLLLHPSTVETDRVDTEFLKGDSDRILVISTRTTAREVQQKLDHYGVDADRATILDTLSVERGYTRRKGAGVRYLSAPDDLDGLVEETRAFLAESDGKRRISLDSLTEMIYYADEDRTVAAVDDLLALLAEQDAVGLFHLAAEVHDEETVERFRERFDGVLVLDEDDDLTVTL
jgi:KaiC/GvpD/RAD55 family RecA-like ATPase